MHDRLDGWKAVAEHVRKSVRTAQRWERELGLPVHRMQAENGEIIYAFASEIDAWIRDRERAPRPRLDASPAHPNESAAPEAVMPQPAPPLTPAMVFPASSGQALLPWFAGGGMLLAGTLLGWFLARLPL